MRRPLRIVLNAATLLSLVMCGLIVALWVRSDQGMVLWRPSAHILLQGDGKFRYYRVSFDEWTVDRSAWSFPSYYAELGAESSQNLEQQEKEESDKSGRCGLEYWRAQWHLIGPGKMGGFAEPAHVLHLGAPRWLCLMVMGLIPMVRSIGGGMRLARRRSRLRRRRCVTCGYDVRATPERCPECGTAVEGARRRPL
jgi:hypothetical protein